MNSRRNVRKSTAEKSRASVEAKGKRKSISEDRLNSQSPSSQKRQKLDTTEEDFKTTNKAKAKPGRPPGPRSKPRQKEQVVITDSDTNDGCSSTKYCTVTDQRSPSRENEKSPKAASFGGQKSDAENQPNVESENMKKFNCLKYNNSFSKTPSPLIIVNISGSNSPQIIDSEELLEFLSAFEGKENKGTEPENVSVVNDVPNLPGIERLEKSPSRFFECPLCYKMFTDGNLARNHLANTCPKL